MANLETRVSKLEEKAPPANVAELPPIVVYWPGDATVTELRAAAEARRQWKAAGVNPASRVEVNWDPAEPVELTWPDGSPVEGP